MALRYNKSLNCFLFSHEQARPQRKACLACGDVTGNKLERMESLRFKGHWPHEEEWLYCEECADEKFRKRLAGTPARTFPTGAGCPLESSSRADDDTSPWGENAVRHLEDG